MPVQKGASQRSLVTLANNVDVWKSSELDCILFPFDSYLKLLQADFVIAAVLWNLQILFCFICTHPVTRQPAPYTTDLTCVCAWVCVCGQIFPTICGAILSATEWRPLAIYLLISEGLFPVLPFFGALLRSTSFALCGASGPTFAHQANCFGLPGVPLNN